MDNKSTTKPRKTFTSRIVSFFRLIDNYRFTAWLFLLCYGAFVIKLSMWFIEIHTLVQKKCDSAVLQTLLDHKISIEQAHAMACTVVGVVGGPTATQTTFVTTIVSLSTAILAFYTGAFNGSKNASVATTPTNETND